MTAISPKRSTLLLENGAEETYTLPDLAFLGRIVGTVPSYTDEQQKRLTALRAALEALDKEDE